MKNFISIGLPFLSLVVFASCNQNSGNSAAAAVVPVSQPQPAALQTSQALDGLSTKDLIMTKYDSAKLHCELDFPFQSMDKGVVRSIKGSSTIDWDVLNDYTEQKTFNIDAEAFENNIVFELDITSIEVAAFEGVEASDGSVYKLLNTPILKGTYNFHTVAPITIEKTSASSIGQGPVTLIEEVPNVLDNEEISGKSADGSFSDDYKIQFNCLFSTQLKPAYRDEFSETAAQK